MRNPSDIADESAVWGPYASYDDVARFEYGRRFWRIPEMRRRLEAHWLDARHPHRERFLERRDLIEEALGSEKTVPALDASLRRRGTTLRCVAREIPVVFGQWFGQAAPPTDH